jgi:hypothetical protein
MKPFKQQSDNSQKMVNIFASLAEFNRSMFEEKFLNAAIFLVQQKLEKKEV